METDKNVPKPEEFYLTVEGEGVRGNKVLCGTDVRFVFHIPKLEISDHNSPIKLGFSVIPIGFTFSENSKTWYQTVKVPCEKTEICFVFKADAKCPVKSTKSGLSLTLNAAGLLVFSQFLSIPLARTSLSPKKSYIKKIDFDLEKKIEEIAELVKKFVEQASKGKKIFF